MSLKVTAKPEEKPIEEMPVEELEEVLPEITKPEEVTPEVISVEEVKPEEVTVEVALDEAPDKKPAFTVSSEEEVTKALKAKVSVKAVTEEEVDSAVTAKFKPRADQEIEVQAQFKKPVEEIPVADAEEVPERLEALLEEQLETAITKADVPEEVVPVEATPKHEEVLDVSQKKPEKIQSVPETEVIPVELVETEEIPEVVVEKREAIEMVVEKEEKAEELPVAPVITHKLKDKVGCLNI